MKSSRTRPAEIERLMDQMREANARLVVAAVHAQKMSDEAREAAAVAKAALTDLTTKLLGEPDTDRLTRRQREVLQLLAEGKSNKEIGAMLGMTTRTAETHRTNIMARLDLHTMSELVRYAIRNRVIKP